MHFESSEEIYNIGVQALFLSGSGATGNALTAFRLLQNFLDQHISIATYLPKF
jgi:nicotinate-nucleotide pyrophosphorylase